MPDRTTSPANEAGLTAQNKRAYRRFQEAVFNRHDWRVETLAQYMTDDFIDHTAGPEAEPGLAGVAHRMARWNAAFSEARKENVAVLAERDLVASLYDLHAVHTGPFMGIAPTYLSVVIPGIEVMRFRDGQISDYWSIYDYLSTAAETRARLTFVPVTAGDGAVDYVPQDVYRGVVHRDRKKHNVYVAGSSTGDDQVTRNKEALLRFQQEVFNGHDWRVETLARHLTPDFVDHAAGPWDKTGLEGVSERFTAWEMAFEEAAEANLAMVGEEDMLAVVYDLHAVHGGDFLGVPATHRHVVIPGIELLRFRDDKIAEHWGIYDFKATAAEIGARLTFTPLESEGRLQPQRRSETPPVAG